MILTGGAIAEAVRLREIDIEPFDLARLNPNSYNFRLGSELLHSAGPDGALPKPKTLPLTSSGVVLRPRNLYLGSTAEAIGSGAYAMTLLGRSSLGRLGLFLNVAADLGHAGSRSHWTLELSVVQPLRIYPHMVVGQIAFWVQYGSTGEYRGRYHGHHEPMPCLDTGLVGSNGGKP